MFCYTSKSHKQVLKRSRPKGNIRREVSYRLVCRKLAKTSLSQTFITKMHREYFVGGKGKHWRDFLEIELFVLI